MRPRSHAVARRLAARRRASAIESSAALLTLAATRSAPQPALTAPRCAATGSRSPRIEGDAAPTVFRTGFIEGGAAPTVVRTALIEPSICLVRHRSSHLSGRAGEVTRVDR
jgi:hypothetical protein